MTRTASGPATEDASATVTRRRGLPGGRAVVGALLITAAVVGVFAAHLNATSEPDTQWVVASADIPRGTTVTEAMLETVPIDLPPGQAAATVGAADLQGVVGRTTLGPTRAGDLVQWTSVQAGPPPEDAATMTFTVPTSRVAHGGQLAAGEAIDIVATYGDTTVQVAHGVELLAGPEPADGGVHITVAVPATELTLAIANALDAGQVFILRSGPTEDEPAPYRPDTQ